MLIELKSKVGRVKEVSKINSDKNSFLSKAADVTISTQTAPGMHLSVISRNPDVTMWRFDKRLRLFNDN